MLEVDIYNLSWMDFSCIEYHLPQRQHTERNEQKGRGAVNPKRRNFPEQGGTKQDAQQRNGPKRQCPADENRPDLSRACRQCNHGELSLISELC